MYFKNLPKTQYTISGEQYAVTDITRMVKITDTNSDIDTIANYTYYNIEDGERPDIVSSKLYGTPNYYWTFFAINQDLKGNLYYDWPLSNQKFENMIINEYDRCSAITFKPIYDIATEYINKTYSPDSRNIFENAILDEKYLPYLELVAEDSGVAPTNNVGINAQPSSRPDYNIYAKILKYNTALCQLVVYDITNPINNKLVEDRTIFIHKSKFYLRFFNPHESGSVEYNSVYDLETEWLYKSYLIYLEDCRVVDDIVEFGSLSYSDDTTRELTKVLRYKNDIENSREYFRREAIGRRKFISTNDETIDQYDYAWDSYRNAAHQYYTLDEYGNEFALTAFDQLNLNTYNKIYTSLDYGEGWEIKDGKSNWKALAVSDDDKYQSAITFNDKIYISNNFGGDWYAREQDRKWNDIAISATGQYQIACAFGSQIFISSDYGDNWSGREKNGSWKSVAINATGQYQLVCSFYDKLYVSDDYGTSWTIKENKRNWTDVAVSSTGKYQVAVAYDNRIYVSSDYGDNWSTDIDEESNETTEKSGVRKWNSVSISNDGKYITATAANDRIYTSSDYGVSWAPRESSRSWLDVGMSDNGEYQTVIEYFGKIYTSSDYGVSWTPRDTNKKWLNVFISRSGRRQRIIVESDSVARSPKFYSHYEYELTQNEKRAQIKIIRPENIVKFVDNYFSKISE
jgi:hypothetical protein